MEEMHRASYVGRGWKLPCSLGAALSLNLHAFTNPETPNPVLLEFYEDFITQAQLIKSLAISD